MINNGPLISPRHQFSRRMGAKTRRIRRDPDPPEIQPVGIPTCLQCWIALSMTIGVQPACLEQLIELNVIQMHQ